MKYLFYLGILKECFSAYSSLVMLISRKMTKDKKVVTDFSHLNMCIAKNNLAHPLLKDTFSMLGSSKCEVMSVFDLKVLSILGDRWKIQRSFVAYFLTLEVLHTCTRECLWV